MEKELNRKISVTFDLNPYNNIENSNSLIDNNENLIESNEIFLQNIQEQHEEAMKFLEQERDSRMSTQLLLDEANLKLQEKMEQLEMMRKFHDNWTQGVSSVIERSRALGDIVTSHQKVVKDLN